MRAIRMLSVFLLGSSLTVSSVGAEQIPLEALFSQPNFISPRLSPDGNKIAYIAMLNEHQVIGVRDMRASAPALIGRNSDTQIRWYWLNWANQNRLLVGSQTLFRSQEVLTKTRFRATRMMGIDIDGGNDRILGRKWPRTSFTAVQYQDNVIHWLPSDPDHVMVAIRELDNRHASAHLMKVSNGALKSYAAGEPNITRLYVDGNGQIRAGVGLINGFVARKNEADPYTTYTIKRTDDPDNYLNFAGFSSDPNIVWVYDTVNDLVKLQRFDLTTQQRTGDVYGVGQYDVGSVFSDPISGNVMGYIFVSDQPNYRFVDPSAAASYKELLNTLPGTTHSIESVSRDGQKAIIMTSGDTLAPHYYLFDRTQTPASLAPVGRSLPKLAGYELAPSTPVSYTTSDGWTINGYLTLPIDAKAKNLPTVVLPHGGPVYRDQLSFDPEVQFLANRGYAVFRINFRGSSGYGKKFRGPAFKAWGGRMQQDISEGVQWLIEQGIADKERIAMYGTSYGGYAALMGGVRTPELYQAVASYAGVTYLPWLENEADEGLRAVSGVFKQMDQNDLESASPAEHPQKFAVPVLLGHGEFDERVHVRHSRRMAQALQKAGKSVAFVEFKDEIHGFLLQENRLKWYATLEDFLHQHIGPAH